MYFDTDATGDESDESRQMMKEREAERWQVSAKNGRAETNLKRNQITTEIRLYAVVRETLITYLNFICSFVYI